MSQGGESKQNRDGVGENSTAQSKGELGKQSSHRLGEESTEGEPRLSKGQVHLSSEDDDISIIQMVPKKVRSLLRPKKSTVYRKTLSAQKIQVAVARAKVTKRTVCYK